MTASQSPPDDAFGGGSTRLWRAKRTWRRTRGSSVVRPDADTWSNRERSRGTSRTDQALYSAACARSSAFELMSVARISTGRSSDSANIARVYASSPVEQPATQMRSGTDLASSVLRTRPIAVTCSMSRKNHVCPTVTELTSHATSGWPGPSRPATYASAEWAPTIFVRSSINRARASIRPPRARSNPVQRFRRCASVSLTAPAITEASYGSRTRCTASRRVDA